MFDDNAVDTTNASMITIAIGCGVSLTLLTIMLLLCLSNHSRKTRAMMSDDSSREKTRTNIAYLGNSNSDYTEDSSNQPSSEHSLLPHLKKSVYRGRLSSDQNSLCEYEIEVDEDWEIPREKYVSLYLGN